VTAERDVFKSRLPPTMTHCKIRFVECPVGHGRLIADNWVDSYCVACKLVDARKKNKTAKGLLSDVLGWAFDHAPVVDGKTIIPWIDRWRAFLNAPDET
jgi:hypothetical protein